MGKGFAFAVLLYERYDDVRDDMRDDKKLARNLFVSCHISNREDGDDMSILSFRCKDSRRSTSVSYLKQ